MCWIQIKNFLFMVKQTENYVILATLRTKQPFIFNLNRLNFTKTNILWANIKKFFSGNLKFPSMTPNSVMFGFLDVDENIFLVSNHILLLFKHFYCISKNTAILLFSRFFRNLQKVYTIEQKVSQEIKRKKKLIYKKWQKTQNRL